MPHTTKPDLPHSADLRRRRRVRAKYEVQTEALRLFAAKGYQQTSVDEIAHAAAISPRTFFRYFACKEDVVLWDEYEELPARELWQVNAGEDPLGQLVRRIRELTAEIYRTDRDRLLERTRLSYQVPEIRARFIDQQLTMTGRYLEQFAEAIGARRDDLGLAVTLASVYGAMLVALDRWQRHGGQHDLLGLIDEAIAALAAGAADLRRTADAVKASKRPSGRRPATR